MKMKEWESYAFKPSERCMNLIAATLKSITSVQSPYLTTFDDLAKNPKEHTKLTTMCGLATSFVVNAQHGLLRIYHVVFGASKGVETKNLHDKNARTARIIYLLNVRIFRYSPTKVFTFKKPEN